MKAQLITCTSVFMILITVKTFSQPLGVQWNHGYGTNDYETFQSLAPTADGGFILGGHTAGGINGSKTEPSQGTIDYWIIKIGATGKKEWDHGFGGDSYDYLGEVRQTADGGYIIGGHSYSGATGDKSDTPQGIWIIKTDQDGVKQWDKTYDGGNGESLETIQQTTDGGYVFGGRVSSNLGSYWIVKLTASGEMEWERKLGGDETEHLYALLQTSDGGYILGGTSESGINGDKTQVCFGQSDYWIIKLDPTGATEWDADFGGVDSDYLTAIQQTSDEGFILMGESYSKINGNKTQPNKGLTDYWAVKVNAIGEKEWDVDFGGDSYEYGRAVTQTTDGGFLLCGSSKSGISGNKTQSCYGASDYWLVKTDANGAIEWDNRIGGESFDDLNAVLAVGDLDFLICGSSTSKKGFDKTQKAFGSSDFWAVKLTPSCVIPTNPATSDITTSSATLSWDEVPGTTGHKVSYREITTTTWTDLSTTATSITLNGLNAGTKYVWKVKSICNNAAAPSSGWTAKQYFTTAPFKLADVSYQAMEVFPNPFSDAATISFSLLENATIDISITDLSGQKLRTLSSGNFEAGSHQFLLERKNLSSGVYLLQIQTPWETLCRKIIIENF